MKSLTLFKQVKYFQFLFPQVNKILVFVSTSTNISTCGNKTKNLFVVETKNLFVVETKAKIFYTFRNKVYFFSL